MDKPNCKSYNYVLGRITRPLILVFCLAILVGCKTTEENYRAAYERTIQKKDQQEDSLYIGLKQRVPDKVITQGEMSFPVKHTWVSITKEGGGINENIKRYCVVAGGFKQSFNAKSMRERLCTLGYPGAFVVQDGEPYFYVVAFASNDMEEAMAKARELQENPPMPLREGMPMILRPSQIR